MRSFSESLRGIVLVLLAGVSHAFLLPQALPVRQHGSVRGRASSLLTQRWRASANDGMEEIGRERRALAGLAVSLAISQLSPKGATADILDAVTGDQKSQDFLARLKRGTVFLPNLRCKPDQPCWKGRGDGQWYEFPASLEEGFTTTPSGLKIKDLAPLPEMAEAIPGSPSFSQEEGTNNIEVFSCGKHALKPYIVNGATAADVAAFNDPKSNSSKFFDVRNKDPRLFQMQNIVLGLGKSNLIPGFLEGVSTMKVGMRRSIVVPPSLGYKDKGANGPAFLQAVPPGATLVFNVQVNKILR